MARVLQDCVYQMLREDELTDVTLTIQDQDFKCHKVIIASRGGLLKELVKQNKQKIEIHEVTPKVFQTILRYIYRDDCHISSSNIFEILHAAIFFKLPDLEKCCVEKLQCRLTQENIGYFTYQALLFNSRHLQKACRKHFGAHTSRILNDSNFLTISYEALLYLSGSKTINCAQVEIFRTCISWAKHKCKQTGRKPTGTNLRAVLAEILDNFSFHKMSRDDFYYQVVAMDILTDEEIGCTFRKMAKDELKPPLQKKMKKGDDDDIQNKDYGLKPGISAERRKHSSRPPPSSSSSSSYSSTSPSSSPSSASSSSSSYHYCIGRGRPLTSCPTAHALRVRKLRNSLRKV